MMQTIAILLYLLPFVTLALILGFVWFAARMAKEPTPSNEPHAEDEVLLGEESGPEFPPPMPEEPADEGSVIRVTRAHDQYR